MKGLRRKAVAAEIPVERFDAFPPTFLSAGIFVSASVWLIGTDH